MSSFLWRRTGLVLCFWLLATQAHPLIAAAAAPADEFERANRLYEQGKYGEAISLYENILREGSRSAPVFFNLGNALFKSAYLGRAIFEYHRAAELAPRDPDIKANLRFARDRVTGGASVEPTAWERAVEYFTLNELAAITAVAFWIWFILLGIALYRPTLKISLRGASRMVLALLLISGVLLAAGCASRAGRVAVATEKNVMVHLGPLPESQAAFSVTDGTELRVEARRGDWVQVIDRSNRPGWVQTNQVAIFPPF